MRSSSDTNRGANGASGPTTRTRDAGTHITTSSLENREASVDQGRTDYSDLSTRRSRNLQGLSAPGRHNQRVGIVFPCPAVHPDLATLAAFPSSDEHRAAGAIEVA